MIEYGKVCNTLGYFWHPEDPAKKYPGALDFSIQEGIRLILQDYSDCFCPPKGAFFADVSYVYGVIQGLGYVTLIGFNTFGVKSTIGEDCYFSEAFTVRYLLLGVCVNPSALIFQGISFSIQELGNMIDENPLSFKLFSDRPYIDEKLSSEVRVKISPNTRNSVDIRNQNLTSQPRSNYLMQSDYYMVLDGPDNNLEYYLSYLEKMEKLFSILCHRQVKAPYVFLRYRNQEYQLISEIQVNGLPCPCKSHLPITIENMKGKFTEIWVKWQEILNYDLVDRYIIDRFYNLVQPGVLQYCLLVPMIEAWQKKHNHEKDKYQNYFEEILQGDSRFCKKVGQELFRCTNTTTFYDFGKAISDIRTLVLHADNMERNNGPRKKYGQFLSDNNLMGYFCELIGLVVSVKIFKELGLNPTDNQKDNLLSFLQNHCLLP